ncbi:MAG: hypothetical protein CM15mP31_4200 [Gammaproteobacteria bacterium]|nr:MAG: hypothetical protein CM15mP31_4200 [Gammaproteobacteria bacterium]
MKKILGTGGGVKIFSNYTNRKKYVLLILIFFGLKKINHTSNIFSAIIKMFLTVKCCCLKILIF